MEKIFINANDLLLDSFELAKQVFASGFKPDFIVGVWRGGAPVGIAVQEYLAYVGHHADHIAIRTSSYTDIDVQHEVRVFGLHYLLENLTADKSLLLVDDVFDTGRSIQAVINALQVPIGNDIEERVKVACPWYKPSRNLTTIIPDYYVNQTNHWLVFPHELIGLSEKELAEKKSDVYQLLNADYKIE